jgi:DNA-binding IclR family transcriptional regulator
MPFIKRRVDAGFDRLQELLLALRAGDTVRLTDITRTSGLSENTCRRALEALARVGLLAQETDDRFVRRALTRQVG